MADRIAIERDLRQLREDYANAVECEDDETTVPTGALGVALAEIDMLADQLVFAREANQVMREAAVHCGRTMPHPPHKWMAGRRLRQCPGVADHETEGDNR